MAAETPQVLFSGNNIHIVNVRGSFVTSDETDTVIIDKSTLIGPDGVNPPGRIRIDEVTWAVGAGFDYVLLEFDHTTDDTIDYFQGQGYVDFRTYGGKTDPDSTGGTGDVTLTTSGGATGDTYSFLIVCTLKE